MEAERDGRRRRLRQHQLVEVRLLHDRSVVEVDHAWGVSDVKQAADLHSVCQTFYVLNSVLNKARARVSLTELVRRSAPVRRKFSTCLK